MTVVCIRLNFYKKWKQNFPKMNLKKEDNLLPNQNEFIQLNELIGVHMDPNVFR